MSRCWIWVSFPIVKTLVLLLLAGCANGGRDDDRGAAPGACEDQDHDGFGRDCANGYDCDDHDAKVTYQCRSCARPELGCPCDDDGAVESCFLPAQDLPEGKQMCSEGTRTCRAGVWSGCESVRQYVMEKRTETQGVVVPSAGRETCDGCDLRCFRIVDNLLQDGGVAGGSVTFGPNGGLVLQPGSGAPADAGVDAGPIGMGCTGLDACCLTMSGPLRTACQATVAANDAARCDRDRAVYCPSAPITGPVSGCTLGSGADTDCDGIPNVVDSLLGKPFSTTNNQTIFHQLDVGESEANNIEVSFKLKNADVYFLLDTTGTMIDERNNLVSTLTSGNVVNCAQLSQCCKGDSDCTDLVEADDQDDCYDAQVKYCGQHVDCADANLDGAPDNNLRTAGVVGAIRCLVGTSWFGTGFFREIPAYKSGEDWLVTGENQRYGDRDEQVYRHLVDMTPDYERVRTALSGMSMNYNWDEPEGGMMALYSALTGKGHYFGVNRPAVPDRTNAQGCASASMYGYPCFRRDAVPVIVFLTDGAQHNGPGNSLREPTDCRGRGEGCPYDKLPSTNTWSTADSESSSDKRARYVSAEAEGFSTAFSLGDIRGNYYSLVGNTRDMAADYPNSIIGCGAAGDSPDALITFTVSAGADLPVRFHLTKNDAYDGRLYGRWDPTWLANGTDDPTPATEFGAVLSLFEGIPASVSTIIDVKDETDNTVVSGPNNAYLSFKGTTSGAKSVPGRWGGVSGCSADGMTNEAVFTFRPSANARIVFDATGSSFPVNLSLHEGMLSDVPANPKPGFANDNDTFTTAQPVPDGSSTIDGNYVDVIGDTNVASIHADYTSKHLLTVSGVRTNNSEQIKGLTHVPALYVGLTLSNAAGWSGDPVSIISLSGNVATMSAKWTGVSDTVAKSISFDDTLTGCNADPNARESVFSFNVSSPRRVRIDTEGSSYDTVISLHDGQPIQSVVLDDVKNNSLAPGYEVGQVVSKAYTLSDTTAAGTTASSSTYDFVQCGAAAAASDAVLHFKLAKPTRIGLDVSSSSWDPIVGLFTATPGQATVLTNGNTNDRVSPPGQDAFNLNDVLGQVSTRVNGSTLSGMGDDYKGSTLSCGAAASAADQVFKFTPLGDTTVRIQASTSVAGFYPVVSVFDGLPPTSTTPPSVVQAYDATAVTLPESTCEAFSFHDSSTGSAAAHVYTLCSTRRYSNDAESKCTGAGMDHLAIINTPGEQPFLAGLVADTSVTFGHHIGAHIPSGSTFVWRDMSPITSSFWASSEPNETSHKCAAMQKGGRWEDKTCTDPGGWTTTDDKAYYLCEDTTASKQPPEDQWTALQLVDLDVSDVVPVQGSTLRMHNDYNAASLMSACNGTSGAGDAVFTIVTGMTGYTVSIDSAGSSYSPVLGLFEGSIDSAGYKACDAAGDAPLTYALQGSRTYYVVVDGTSTSQEGSYKLKFTKTGAAAVENGLYMNCGAGMSGAPTASVDVEVEGNHTYYFVVDSATSSTAVGAYTLQVSALYQARTAVTNTVPANERGVSAFALPDPYRSRISVVSTSTSGMAADYSNSVVCSAESGAPDAVYKLRPSVNTGLKITATPLMSSGLATPVVGLFDGPPPTTPVLHDLAADGNVNDALANAEPVSFGSSTQRYEGNTSALAVDVDPALASCGASHDARDAMFSFTLTETTQVEIDASASAMADPVLRLFKDGPRSRPTATPLENDDRSAANANPAPTPDLQGAWLHYSGDMARLTSDAQVQQSLAADNSDGSAQNLLDLASRRVTLGGADTSGMQADYPGACSAADGGKDALYTFTSSTAARVRVAAAPSSGQKLELSLYEGGNGPLRQVDLSSATEDRSCVDLPPAAPRNVTRTTLDLIAVDLASAVDVNLSCASPAINTTDPDGSGAQIVSFTGWCGPTPTAYVQAQAGGPDAVVLLMKSLQVQSSSTLRVTGDRPLIFVVTQDATIDGAINASGDFTTNTAGAGGGVSCGSSAGGDADISGSRSGGGGGGGYGTAGGLGGVSDALAGGSAGAVRGNTDLVPLLGGCNGGKSGALGNAGRAGGAVQISTLGTLSVSGQIRANGALGVIPSLTQHGGSGAGSGGAILVEASKLTLGASVLSVNGGQGTTGAGGGGLGGSASTSSGTPGGDGGVGSTTSGGGGGGGGYGRIRSEERSLSLAPCPDGPENLSSAAVLDAQSSGRTLIELGNLTSMQHDYDLTGCDAAADAHDAVYAFTLSDTSDIRIDVPGSQDETVIGLFEASQLMAGKPASFCASKAKGMTIKERLDPGDYFIVVSSTKTSGDKFEVHVQNINYDSAKSSEVACDGSSHSLQYDLKAGVRYYLLVKGLSAADSGSYGLFVETAGTAPSLGCGASPGAADAVYKFHLASPRAVSIDTIGSSMDTVLALYPSTATSFDTTYARDVNDEEVPCDANGSGALSPRIDASLQAGDYYVVVKSKTLDWTTPSQPYQVSIRDAATTSPLACASASIGGKKILQTLQPGDYRLVVSGETAAGGAYAVKFRDVSHFGLENGVQLACVSGSGNSVTYGNFEAGRDYYVVVKGGTASDSGPYTLTVEDTVSLSAAAGSTAVACAAEGSTIDGVYPAGDYYALVSGAAAAAGGPYTLRVQDLDTQNDQNRLACNDDGGPNKTSAIETTVGAGTHYVVVKGKGVLDRGGYRLRVRDLDSVNDHRLACAGDTAAGARLEYDVKANKDYTLILKGGATGAKGAYDLKMFDKVSVPSSMGSRLDCKSDAQPEPLKNTDWDTDEMFFDRTLKGDKTYYLAVKGVRASDAGFFQLQVGDPSARTKATFEAPTWDTTHDALIASGVRVLPVIATKNDTGTFVPVAEAQAQMLAEASGATRKDGTAIWQKINKNGTGTGSGLVTAIADLAAHLAMDVSLSAVDGPDAGATLFQINIAPLNSPNCESPHPLVDASGACTGTSPTQNCNTQYKCRPGAAPKFRVTFTNPATTPVKPNPGNPYGGYLFKLQLKGDGKYLLDEIPVFLIPTTKMLPPPAGSYKSEGTYAQNLDALSCKEERADGGGFEFNPRSTDLPRWRDLFFKADVPEGASIEFELCTADSDAKLAMCEWSEGGKRPKIVVTGGNTCTKDAECLNVTGKGNGFCSDFGSCQFITKPKVDWDLPCNQPSDCKSGPFGAGDYYISKHCEMKGGEFGYGHCVYHSAPLDIGATLLPNEDGKLFSKIRIKLLSNAAGNATPTLYEWYLTYTCQSSL